MNEPAYAPDDISQAFGYQTSTSITAGLNPNQALAVETMDGPLRILAGAGTGKTTVLTKRIINIIKKDKARPQQILAVTFTRKAANEMKARLAKALGSNIAALVQIGTFHSISSNMLRAFSYKIDLSKNYTILDDSAQKDIITDLSLRLGLLDSKKNKETISKYHGQIMSWKEQGYTLQDVLAAPDLFSITNSPLLDEPVILHNARHVFKAYQTELMDRNWCDYADLILHMVHIFRKDDDVRRQQAARFKYVLVDEFQDSSPMQNEFVTLLAKDHNNICVVGDTDQSIYEWRQAAPKIMLDFPKNWPNCKEITIDTNYRSSQEILDVSNAVVSPLRFKDGLDKLLTSDRHGPKPKDLFKVYDSGYEEADQLAHIITEKIAKGIKPSEIAILCRSGMIIRGIETALRTSQIKYIVAGAQKFTEREEIKDSIAWLTLAINPSDYISFQRIISKPTRGFGAQKINDIKNLVIRNNISIRDAAAEIATSCNPKTKTYRDYTALVEFLDIVQSITINGNSAGEILENILEESGYLEMRRTNEKDDAAEYRLENLDLLIKEARDYSNPQEFLEVIALQSASDEAWDENSIVISTVHAAKGLEFDCVFCPAMEEGVFPNSRSEKTDYGPDEERRLAHVAWTRARKELYVSYALYRMGGSGSGIPSKFIEEAGFMGEPELTYSQPDAPRKIRPRQF